MEAADTAWTGTFTAGEEVVIPVKHGEGRYVADAGTVAELEAAGRVVMRYVGGNPNGSVADIAGVCSAERTVVGLMPHPEHAVENLTGPTIDGLRMFMPSK
jgi:phosphoribosylformylglycinamidine synthase